jgi:hypothetical protein
VSDKTRFPLFIFTKPFTIDSIVIGENIISEISTFYKESVVSSPTSPIACTAISI